MSASGDANTRAHKLAAAAMPEDEAEKNKKHVSKSLLDKQMRKTRLCRFYKSGMCKYGTKCTFAHQRDELQEAPNLRKTRICKAFMNGECKDPLCKFAHGQDELRSTDLCFKTTLCVWHAQGKCTNGSRCRFAHGAFELRRSGSRAMRSSEEESIESSAGQQQAYHDPVKVQPAASLPAFPYPGTGNAVRPQDDPQLSLLYNMAYLSALDAMVSDAEQQVRRDTAMNNLRNPLNKQLSGQLGFNTSLSSQMGAPMGLSEQLYNPLAPHAPSNIANQVASQLANQQFMNNLSLL